MSKSVLFFAKTIQESALWIAYVGFVFGVGIICGLIISLVNPDLTREFFVDFGDSVQKIVTESGVSTALNIFERNATIVLASLVLCIFGLVPTLVVFFNGIVFGMIFGFQEIYESYSIVEVLFLVLPHGVIELTAVLIGLGLATKTGVRWIFARSKIHTFQNDARDLAHMSFYVVGLLFLAAVVEAFVTPLFSCFLFRICL